MQLNTETGIKSDLPFETRIYYSKRKLKKLINILLGFMVVDGVLVFLVRSFFGGAYFLGSFMMIFLVIVYTDVKKKYKNDKPQIIINEDGIESDKVSFWGWENITNETVDFLYGRNASGEHLVYDYPAGQQKLSLGYIETNRAELKNLLKIYRQRNEKKRAHTRKADV